MKTICPVTGNECPYDQKLISGVCPKEHECDVIRAEYANMLKKPPMPQKYILISLAVVIVLATASILYFLVFDGTLDFRKNNIEVHETALPTSSPAPIIVNTAQSTPKPTAVTTPGPTVLPAVPITDAEASSIVRINISGILHEVKNVGLDLYQRIEAYPDARIVSWYDGSDLPSGSNNSILFGFKYYNGLSGAFYFLDTVEVGDKIGFTLDNGTVVDLEIYDKKVYGKNSLPTEVFELESTSPRTVLITQSGDINSSTGDYMDMLVVYLH